MVTIATKKRKETNSENQTPLSLGHLQIEDVLGHFGWQPLPKITKAIVTTPSLNKTKNKTIGNILGYVLYEISSQRYSEASSIFN